MRTSKIKIEKANWNHKHHKHSLNYIFKLGQWACQDFQRGVWMVEGGRQISEKHQIPWQNEVFSARTNLQTPSPPGYAPGHAVCPCFNPFNLLASSYHPCKNLVTLRTPKARLHLDFFSLLPQQKSFAKDGKASVFYCYWNYWNHFDYCAVMSLLKINLFYCMHDVESALLMLYTLLLAPADNCHSCELWHANHFRGSRALFIRWECFRPLALVELH